MATDGGLREHDQREVGQGACPGVATNPQGGADCDGGQPQRTTHSTRAKTPAFSEELSGSDLCATFGAHHDGCRRANQALEVVPAPASSQRTQRAKGLAPRLRFAWTAMPWSAGPCDDGVEQQHSSERAEAQHDPSQDFVKHSPVSSAVRCGWLRSLLMWFVGVCTHTGLRCFRVNTTSWSRCFTPGVAFRERWTVPLGC